MAIILSSIASAEEIRVGGASVKSGQSVDNLKMRFEALRASVFFLTSDFTDFTDGGIVVIYMCLLGFQPTDVRDGEKIDSPSARGGGCIGALNAPMQMN